MVLLVGSFACQNKSEDNLHIIIPGIGYDKFLIDSTKLSDITSLYGDNYMIDTVKWPDPFDTLQVFCINYSYDKLGVTFKFYPNSRNLKRISLTTPFQGTTYKKIILGESTFRQIVKNYGYEKWSYIGNLKSDPIAISKHYDGIYFNQDFPKGLKYDDKMPDKYLDEYLDCKVTSIDIVKIMNK